MKISPFTLNKAHSECKIMSSLAKPKRVTFIGSDNKEYRFLLKYDQRGGDMIKESRFIDFANFVNVIFDNEQETKKRSLSMKTYAINPLTIKTGLIEWIDDTSTIKSIIKPYWDFYRVKSTHEDFMKKYQNK